MTRLRSDAKLFDLPVDTPGQRGRLRKYGKNRISLKKRATDRRGWKSILYSCRGKMAEGRYKTFLSTSHVVVVAVRVVLLEYRKGNWAAYVSSDTAMSVALILKTVSDRWAIDEHFHDVKEIWGAGEQQLRNLWSNVDCWHLCGWHYTMVELECWDEASEQLIDRRDRPWDNPDRRPSHNDRRREIARKMQREAFLHDLPSTPDEHTIREQFERLLDMAALQYAALNRIAEIAVIKLIAKLLFRKATNGNKCETMGIAGLSELEQSGRRVQITINTVRCTEVIPGVCPLRRAPASNATDLLELLLSFKSAVSMFALSHKNYR